MSATSLFKYLHLAYLAKPVVDRVIYRTIRKLRAGHLVAIGLGTGEAAKRMIQLAAEHTDRPQVRFTGIDLFETRPTELPPLSLKGVHRMLTPLGARVQLVPGDPATALARIANTLPDTDLVVVRADQNGASMQNAWFYLPRMLHERSVVLVEDLGTANVDHGFRELDYAAVVQLARHHSPRRRAA